MSRNIRRALISVYDKTGIVEFARALHDEFAVEIVSTGGTARTLTEAGIPVTLVETITGFPEMLDGRVKTLHPKIHAAILADRDNPEHMRQLAAAGIEPIDMVVVNLYPFEKTIADPDCTFEQAIEMIDIGGPCLLRAAAKNHKHVVVVSEINSYDVVLGRLRDWTDTSGREDTLKSGAFGAFWDTSGYDARVSEWLSLNAHDSLPDVRTIRLWSWGCLRYGENPHQCAEMLMHQERQVGLDLTATDTVGDGPSQPNLSFNNYVDADAALGLCAELTRADAHNPLWHRLLVGAETTEREFARIAEQRFHRRNLPHIQRPGASYFVTFRLREGSLSASERDTVVECCLFPHASKCSMHACVVMPDHVHLLLTPLTADDGRVVQLGEIIKSIKGVSARRINQARGRTGPFWLDEYFDRIIRHEKEMWETIDYIHENPSRKGLDRDGPYPWCLFEDEPVWDASLHAVEAATGPLRAGQRLPTRTVAPRPWFGHRLIAGATKSGDTNAGDSNAGDTSSGDAKAGDSSSGDSKAGATRAGDTCGTGYQPVQVSSGTSAVQTSAVACFIKHTNACGVGVAVADDADRSTAAAGVEAYRRAYLGDPSAAMGGVLAVDFEVDAEFAAVVMETYQRFGKPLREAGHPAAPGGFFVEVWVAPGFTDDAIKLIRGELEPSESIPAPPKKNWGKRVRLLAVGEMGDAGAEAPAAPGAISRPLNMNIKSIAGGVLMQTSDDVGLNEDQWRVVTQRAPTERELNDLRLAWLVCKHTKSNAISICRDGMLIGNGAGQMSRVMSCRVATWMARENAHLTYEPQAQARGLRGTGNEERGTGREPGARGGEQETGGGEPQATTTSPVAASDAFFPFRDGPDLLIDAGVTAIIQPGGSKRDEDVIAACDERGVAMIFTGTRHFRH